MLQITIFDKKIWTISIIRISLFKGITQIQRYRNRFYLLFLTGSENSESGYLISQSGEPVNSLMIVIKGTVKGEMVDYAGRVIKIEDIPAPGALASAFMFGNRNRFPVNVIAISDGEILLIEKPDFLKLLMRNDIILVNFLDMISNRSQFLSEKIKFLNFKTIKGKLAQFILQKAEGGKSSIILDMTQNDLADFFGVARPSVARALVNWKRKDLLKLTERISGF